MRLLLDTHVVVWWLAGATQLPAHMGSLIKPKENEVYVSAASCWEIGIKVRAGRWPEADHMVLGIVDHLAKARLIVLSITAAHAERAALLEIAHKDPFDRLLAAQAMAEELTLVSIDPVFAGVAGLAVV